MESYIFVYKFAFIMSDFRGCGLLSGVVVWQWVATFKEAVPPLWGIPAPIRSDR